ncbi:HEPN domain-containing protein [Sedimentibacter sp.]|uniref:HEPN domain-containing protein n=2 Tax=Sedimentibacter sp. TaxID=1960295 RepID=UPI0028A97B48|nr:HEPN domain-containing protein [Sedimentibacter sp.]
MSIDIYIPICLATFEDDNINLSEQVKITRIPDDIQKSRQQACLYETNNEDWLASCATHMIVLHNYHFNNDEFISINKATRNYHAYPLVNIDEIMAIIRVVTGYTIGYEQILTRPLNWIDDFCADLTSLYGAKSHFVNAKEIDKMWMHLSVSKISSEQVFEIQKLYATVLSSKADKAKGGLTFALRRLNRCMLRDEDDDMAIDATIGLETLLSGGNKSEITYTISNRISVVFAHERNEHYTQKNCREIMKKIYNYRSKVVHGDTIKEKDKYHKINDSEVEIEKIAVDFLRYTILFVLHNTEYLDAKKFDEFIDCTVYGEQIK